MKRFLVLWCMIAVPFFMISCKNDAGNTQSQMLTGVFTKEEIVLDENFTPNGSLTTEGNFMYLMGTTMTDEGNTSSVAVLNMEDMTISYDILPDDTYESLAVSNGNYLLTSSYFDEMTFQNIYASYYQMRSVFGEEANADIVGYPSSEGGASKLSANAFYSITEESKVKEGAMAFLRYLLSADCVIDEMRGMRSIPSLKTTAKAWDDSESKMYYYFYYDHVGRWSANSKLITEEDEGVPGICIQLTQEKIDAVYDFLDHVNVYPYIPSDITAILDEEMYVFLGTTKSADETAKIIQSRVSTYLSERG